MVQMELGFGLPTYVPETIPQIKSDHRPEAISAKILPLQRQVVHVLTPSRVARKDYHGNLCRCYSSLNWC